MGEKLLVLLGLCLIGGLLGHYLAAGIERVVEKYIVPCLKKLRKSISNHAIIYLMTQLEKLYFCGYQMTEVYCKHLKMHRVRCVRRYHRIVKQAYENWLRENDPEKLAS